jgi:phytanoyl-CoA hydroxylase
MQTPPSLSHRNPQAPSFASSSNISIPDGFSLEEVEQFSREGFVIARSLADEPLRMDMHKATLDGLGREIGPVEYEADLHYPGAPESRSAQGGRTIRRLKNALCRHPAFGEWLGQSALINRLRQLVGPELVVPLAHHNCIMTKQPEFSSDTGWHQDIRYWSYTRPELVSVWLALGPENLSNGCLHLIPGTHRMTFERHRFDDDLFFRPDLPENAELIATKIPAELAPGDVLFFHCRTFHAASRNHTTSPKFSVVFTVRPADNPPLPGSRSASMPELLISSFTGCALPQ